MSFFVYGWIAYFVSFIIYPFRRLLARPTGVKYEVKIIGSGKYLPERCVDNNEIARIINEAGGGEQLESKRNWLNDKFKTNLTQGEMISQYYGIDTRYWSKPDEMGSDMGAEACKQALASANLKPNQIDAVYYAAASFDQAIPDTSVFLHRKLGMEGVPAHTVHSTCISFLHAFNDATAQIESGRYKNVLIVSAEKGTFSINPLDPKSYVIIGDSSAAIVLSRSDQPSVSYVDRINLSTHSELSDAVALPLGNMQHPTQNDHKATQLSSTFRMDTKTLLDKTPKLAKEFLKIMGSQDYKYVVAHQPSKIAIQHVYEMFPTKTIIESFRIIGNCVAASIPYNLCSLIDSGRLNRGEKILLVGTGAGLGIGGIVLAF